MSLRPAQVISASTYFLDRWVRCKHMSGTAFASKGGIDYTVLSEMQAIGHSAFPAGGCKDAGMVDIDTRNQGVQMDIIVHSYDNFLTVGNIMPAQVGDFLAIQDGCNYVSLGRIVDIQYYHYIKDGDWVYRRRLFFDGVAGDCFHIGSDVFTYNGADYFSDNIAILEPSYLSFRYEEPEAWENAFKEFPVKVLPCFHPQKRPNDFYHAVLCELPSDERIELEPGLYSFVSWGDVGDIKTDTWEQYQYGMARPFYIKLTRRPPVHHSFGNPIISHAHTMPSSRNEDVKEAILIKNGNEVFRGNASIHESNGLLIVNKLVYDSLKGFDDPRTYNEIRQLNWGLILTNIEQSPLAKSTFDAAISLPSGRLIARRFSDATWWESPYQVVHTIDLDWNANKATYAAGVYIENDHTDQIEIGDYVRFRIVPGCGGEDENYAKVYRVAMCGLQNVQLGGYTGINPYTAMVIINSKTRQENVVPNPDAPPDPDKSPYDFLKILSTEFNDKFITIRRQPIPRGQIGIYQDGQITWRDLVVGNDIAELGKDKEPEVISPDYDVESQRYQATLKNRAHQIISVKTPKGKGLTVVDKTNQTITVPSKNEVFVDYEFNGETRFIVNSCYAKLDLEVYYEWYEGHIVSMATLDGVVYGLSENPCRMWEINADGTYVRGELTGGNRTLTPLKADTDSLWFIDDTNILRRFSKKLSLYAPGLDETKNCKTTLGELAQACLCSIELDDSDLTIRPLGSTSTELTQTPIRTTLEEDLQSNTIGLTWAYSDGTYKVGTTDKGHKADYTNKFVSSHAWAKVNGDKVFDLRRMDKCGSILTLFFPQVDLSIKPSMKACYNGIDWIIFAVTHTKPNLSDTKVEGDTTEAKARLCQPRQM